MKVIIDLLELRKLDQAVVLEKELEQLVVKIQNGTVDELCYAGVVGYLYPSIIDKGS